VRFGIGSVPTWALETFNNAAATMAQSVATKVIDFVVFDFMDIPKCGARGKSAACFSVSGDR
jgi:hypothetical protein